MKKQASRRGIKISPWITLFIGYILGCILYPVLQLWTCHCPQQDVPADGWSYAGHAAPAVRISSDDFIPRYLQPSASWLRPQMLGRPKTLAGEYRVRKRLFVAVITAEKYLPTRARAVYDTWGSSVTRISFFVGADCNTSHPTIQDLPIVKLPGIPDNVYPPQKKVFAVLQYIHNHYIDDFQWFMRADDDVYVRGEKLEELLGTLNFNDMIYLGLAGMGKAEDIHRLGLRPHERYCMGGPGVIFSSGTLRELAPYLQHCLSAVNHHNEENPDNPWYNEDVELGRCVSRCLNIQCSTSAEGRSYFIQDYTSAALHPLTLWQNPVFKDLITLHPIKKPEHLYTVHHYYKVMQARLVQEGLKDIETGINDMCEKIPSNLAPPWQIMPTCTVQLCSGVWTEVGVATFTTPFTVATKLPKVYNPRCLYELTPWEHFSTSTKHSITGLSPEHGLYTTFQVEISGIVSLIQHHLNSVQSSTTVGHLEPVEVIQGYTRFNEEIGREYILEVMFVAANNRSHIVNKRIRLIRPLSQDITMVTERGTSSTSTVVNVILPIFQVDETFIHFMTWYYKSTHDNVHLILCVIANTDILYTVQSVVANHTKDSPRSRTTVLSGTADLSPTGALELGVSVLNEHALVFIADTDLRIRSFFYRSCRQNTFEGRKVYYPIPYIMFNEPHRSPGPGRWGFYSYSSMCIYKSDFLKFSDTPKRFFERVSTSSMEIFQAPEPGLIKVSKPETCDDIIDAERQEYCRDTLISSQFSAENIDYLYRHDQTNHKPLSYIQLEETL